MCSFEAYAPSVIIAGLPWSVLVLDLQLQNPILRPHPGFRVLESDNAVIKRLNVSRICCLNLSHWLVQTPLKLESRVGTLLSFCTSSVVLQTN